MTDKTPTADLVTKLDNNQQDLVSTLLTSKKSGPVVSENLGAQNRITSKIPAHEPDAQPVQGRGRIVWNRAYSFLQAHGPSYLDPIPDPGSGGGY